MEDKAPLTEGVYYILLSLYEPRHGYGIMQFVSELSKGRVELGPGTIYGAIKTMVKRKWIVPLEEDGRKKEYVITDAGMMMVVFTIANMFAGGPGYIVAVIIGNIIVAVLEALLAGIQVLRLEFYEMFGKFFDGQGRVFAPVKVSETTN